MTKMNKNTVALAKGFVVTNDANQSNTNMVATVQSHLMKFGYMLDQNAFDALAKTDVSHIVDFHDAAITYLKDITGGAAWYSPLYKNFPGEVMMMSDVELYLNAMVHYWTNGAWEPSTVTFTKPIRLENIKYNMIKSIDDSNFGKIFTDLVSVNTSLTPTDKSIVEWFATSGEKLVIPETIPFKETLCTLAALKLNVPIKSPTDVLRIAVHMSGGDVSLPCVPELQTGRKDNTEVRDKFKFKKFTRSERRHLLSLLEDNCDVSAMATHDKRWIRLGEVIHPGEFKSKYPKAAAAFGKIRNGEAQTWHSKVDAAFTKDFKTGLALLATRPGEFARKLDYLVRNYGEANIMPTFDSISKGVSNKVLIELYSHFSKRDTSTSRSIMIKGKRKRTAIPTLDPLDSSVVKYVGDSIMTTMGKKFAALPPLGNCAVDESLKFIPMPTNMRSMSVSAKPTIRGQRIPFNDATINTIRPFVHWTDKNGSEDLDLSVTFVGKKVDVCNFGNIRIDKYVVHSGDVRHRVGNCAEYVDINIKNAVEAGHQYAVIDVRNFNGRGLNTVDSRFGIMEREYPNHNNTWLPETITNSHVLGSEAISTTIAILDLVNKEYIMVDADSNGINARGDTKNILALIEHYAQPAAFSVYDLVMLHVNNRGKLAQPGDTVDTHFKNEDFIHSYELTGKLIG